MGRKAVQMQLEFTAVADPVAGTVSLEGEPVRTFTGWIGLNGAIDALLEAAAEREAGAEPPSGA